MILPRVSIFRDLDKLDKAIIRWSEETFSIFTTENLQGLGRDALANMANNYLLSGGIFICVFVALYLIFGREKSEDVLQKICSKIGLIFKEKTDQPLLKRNRPVKDKLGKVKYVTIEHVPKFDFKHLPASFIISNIHNAVSKNLFNYLNGLLTMLKEHGFIENDSGSVASTGYPGEFIVSLHDRKTLDQRAMFREIRWYKEEIINGIRREHFPDISIDDSGVTIRLPDELKINDDIIRRGLETFSRFFDLRIKSYYERSSDQTMIYFKYQTALNKIFQGKDTIPACLPAWQTGIIDKMVEYYEKEGEELAFVGELEDPNITWPSTQIFWKLTQSPHFMVIGQTRSGKSKSIVSLVSTFAKAYPRSGFLFADGKNSADYDGFAKVLSNYPVAKISNGDDSLIELANVIFISLQEYERRQKKIEAMSMKGFPCSTYVEYNKYISKDPNLSDEEKEEMKIRRYFVVIDEFAEFCRDAPDSVEKLLQIKGTIFWGIAKLLRAAASVGITMVIAAQRYQNSDFPTPIRSNLTNWLIHNINVRDAEGIGMVGLVEKLSAGRYILRVPGLYCEDTKNADLRCAMPYVGDDTKAMIEALGRGEQAHNEYNYDLIYNSGREEDFSKLTAPVLLKMIKQAFLAREGYEIIQQSDPEMDYISLVFKDHEGRLYNLGLVDSDEISDFRFTEKLLKQRNEYFDRSRKIFFVSGRMKEATSITNHLREMFGKVHILRELDYSRPLKQALAFYRDNNKTKIFHTLLDIEEEEKVDPTPLFNPKFKDKHINLSELERIKNIEGSAAKGDAFEDWFLLFEKRNGFDTVTARSLIDDGVIPNIFASKRAEGGFDLIRWIDRDKMLAVGIQLKNQVSKALDTSVIDKTVKSRLLYQDSGINISDTLLVTTGNLTKQASQEAVAVGVRVVTGEMLINMIKEYEEMQPDRESIKEVIDSYDSISREDDEEEIPFLDEDSEEAEDSGLSSLKEWEEFMTFDDNEEISEETKKEHQEEILAYIESLNKDGDS